MKRNADNFNFKKKYGQNFLKDDAILNEIASAGHLDKETLTIEIGVGKASLTKKLCEVSKMVIGYEIDDELVPIIKEEMRLYDNFSLINADFLTRDYVKDTEKYTFKTLAIVSNLPYYITTPIISKIIASKSLPRCVFMVQDEVANRLSAKPGTSDFGSFTVFLNYYYDIKKAFKVMRTSFYPVPNVDSAVIVMTHKENKYLLKDEAFFFKLVRAAFAHKRKNLKNNLFNYDLKVIEKVLSKHSKSLQSRAEDVSLEEFIEISNALS